jgi:outer membrane protein TolC
MIRSVRLRSRSACTALALLFVATADTVQGQTTQPQPVPLSGKTGGGSIVTTQTPVPGPTTGVNTLNPAVVVQGPFAGSVPGASKRPIPGTLSMADAIQRGLDFNLGAASSSALARQVRGQRAVARSALLPNIVGDVNATRQTVNLGSFGFTFPSIAGFEIPDVVGPFNNFDVRARVSLSVFDRTAWNNFHAAEATVRADELSVTDARELIVLGVAGAYLQVVAVGARLDSARAQLETANALYEQNAARRRVGIAAQLDVSRSQVQALTQQQRMISLQNDFAKQKINLARMVGLPPTEQYMLSDTIFYKAAPPIALDELLRLSRERRADLKAAGAQVEAAEKALAAAHAARLPTLQVNADLGAIGASPAEVKKTYSVAAAVRVPVWLGGRTDGQIQQAEAALAQRRAERDDLSSQIEGDVRKANLDLQAVTAQVDVADRNRQVAREALNLTRQRFDAGVSDSVEVIQAQEALSSAELDYINSLFAHNVAKLNVARMIGQGEERLADFLKP